jgi:hypothetical protein
MWLEIDGSDGYLFSSTSGLLLAKSEKIIEFMIPTPRVPTVGAK